MAQEAQHEPDSRLKIIERPVEDGDEEEKNGGGEETNGGGDAGEEKNGGRGDTVDEVGCEDDTDEEDSEDELRGFDEDGNPYKPFIWRRQLRICPAGPHFSMEEAEKIVDSVWERNEKLLSEW